MTLYNYRPTGKVTSNQYGHIKHDTPIKYDNGLSDITRNCLFWIIVLLAAVGYILINL